MRVLSPRAECAPAVAALVAAIALSAGPAAATVAGAGAETGAEASAKTYKGGGKYLMTVVDSTQGWTENTNANSSSATRSSAEVIAEAPSGSGGREALADFGKAAFTGSMVAGTAIRNSSPMALTMYSGGLDASTSKLSGTENFKVTWKDY